MLDNGASMGRLAGVSPPTAANALAQQAVLSLLPTMTVADETSLVVLFLKRWDLNSKKTFAVTAGTEEDNDPVSLSSAVSGAALSDDDGPSDLAAGMQQAFSIFSSPSPEALKVQAMPVLGKPWGILLAKPWGILPQELVERIFAQLSRREAFGLQLVCRDWRRTFSYLLSVHEFRWEEDQYCPVMLANQFENNFFGFNLVARQWRRLPPVYRPNLRAVSDGSLLCWPSYITAEVVVCNPVRNTVTRLPALAAGGRCEHIIGALFAGFENGGSDYCVVALSTNYDMSAGPARAFMYESSKGAWNGLKCNMQEGDARSGLFISLESRCIFLDHSIFAPAGESLPGHHGFCAEFTHLVEYDLELEAWRNTCRVDWPGCKKLLRCASSVVIVTLEPVTREMLVHRLNRGTRQMELVARNSLHAAGFHERLKFFTKVWNISAAGSKVYIGREDARRFPQVASYDILNGDTGAWEQLPRCPFPPTRLNIESDFVMLSGVFDLR